MVGGIVIETIDTGAAVWVNCQGIGCEQGEQCAILIERSDRSRSISEGDSIWWQSRLAMWTPRGRDGLPIGGLHDIRLNRIGYSGAPRPSMELAPA